MKKIIFYLSCTALLILPISAKAQCSWFNAAEENCLEKFETALEELKKDFPKVKNTSPFYKIYQLTTNNDNELCHNFLKMAEDLRFFHTQYRRDKPISPEILNIIGSPDLPKDLEQIETENIRFTKLTPDSYLADTLVKTGLYTYYSTYKLTNEIKEIPTDNFIRFPIKEADPLNDDDYRFYHNNTTNKFHVFSYDAISMDNNYFKGFIYELSTADNQINPICEYDIKVRNFINDNAKKFPELLRLYKIIAGDNCCKMTTNDIYHIDDKILAKTYLLLLNPDKFTQRYRAPGPHNIWSFYNDWASLSPVNRMQYQKFLTELEKYGNYIGKTLQQHLEIKNEEQLNTLKYHITKHILNDIPVIYDYDTYRKQPSDFIKKIQNNTISDDELKENISKQYEFEHLYGDAWLVEPPLFHAIPHPELLKRMIDIGYDTNVPNWYSKTPLMTTAHLNNYEATQILLKAKADINKTMGKLTSDNLFKWDETQTEAYGVERQNRTALMYACENADYKLINLLINNGADIHAQDSLNNGIDYYLNLNNKITQSEKKKILNLLKNQPKKL